MIFYGIKKIYRPEIFQGFGKKTSYFEGWYFKLVDRKTENIFAVIPGISISNIKDNSHAFIQIMDGRNASSKYFRFDFIDFSYSNDKFEVRIGKNFFSSKKLVLNIGQDFSTIRADLQFLNPCPWPKSPLAPGAMGWYAFAPFMECYHGVLSMDHVIKGHANFEGKDMDFSGGKGYIEKDWGVSFPQGWIWLQSNHFNKESVSIMLSIAKIPWRGRHFTGFICGFLNDEKIHIFATYNGSTLKLLDCDGSRVKVILENKIQKITIEAKHQKSSVLLSPVLGAMDGRINESIDSDVNVRLEKKSLRKSNYELVFDGNGSCAGLEIINPQALDIKP